jgi:hypothetical protein
MLLAEGYDPADVDAAWRHKNGYYAKDGFLRRFGRSLKSPGGKELFLQRSIGMTLAVFIPVVTLYKGIELYPKVSWYLSSTVELTEYQKYRLMDYELLTAVYVASLLLSAFVATVIFVRTKTVRSRRYVFAMLAHFFSASVSLFILLTIQIVN